jgi:predicted AAA+ superfamily ATPase
MYTRLLEKSVISALGHQGAVVIYGPRQVGKTTLVRKIGEAQGEFLYLNCDEPDVRDALTDQNSVELRRVIGDYNFVIID